MSKSKNRRKSGKQLIRRGELTLQRREVVCLVDGTIGYGMFPGRLDDCMRAAVATVLQVPPQEIPDPQIERRLEAGHDTAAITRQSWAQLERWLSERGLRLLHHEAVPLADERWIGVCPAPGNGVDETMKAIRRKASDLGFGDIDTRHNRRLLGQAKLRESVARSNQFSAHCLVMSRDGILFDPAVGLEPLPGMRMRRPRPSDVTWGLSFEPIPEGGI